MPENKIISKIPSQKIGMETPIKRQEHTAIIENSVLLDGRDYANQDAKDGGKDNGTNASSIVAGKRAKISLTTGVLV